MINKETENVRSSEDIEMAFRALSKEFRPYVTAEELYAVIVGIKQRYSVYLINFLMFVFKITLNLLYYKPIIIFYFQNLSPEQAEYCIKRMKPYVL